MLQIPNIQLLLRLVVRLSLYGPCGQSLTKSLSLTALPTVVMTAPRWTKPNSKGLRLLKSVSYHLALVQGPPENGLNMHWQKTIGAGRPTCLRPLWLVIKFYVTKLSRCTQLTMEVMLRSIHSASTSISLVEAQIALLVQLELNPISLPILVFTIMSITMNRPQRISYLDHICGDISEDSCCYIISLSCSCASTEKWRLKNTRAVWYGT